MVKRITHSTPMSISRALRLCIGEQVALELQAPRRRLILTMLGFKEGAGVIVTAPKSLMKGQNTEGSVATLRMVSGNYLCAFKTRVDKVLTHPYPHFHLSYPDSAEFQTLRHHERIPVNLTVSVDHQREEYAARYNLPKLLYCRDLGMKGASIEASDRIAPIGESLFLTFRFRVQSMDQIVLLPATLKNIEELEPGVVLHGVEFDALEEDTELLLAAFYYQQYLIELGYLGHD